MFDRRLHNRPGPISSRISSAQTPPPPAHREHPLCLRRSRRRIAGPATIAMLLAGAGLPFARGQTTAPADQRLPGTEPLMGAGDLAADMVAGIDRHFTAALSASATKREGHWQRDYSSPEAYARSIEPNRKRFARIIGAVDPRVPATGLHLVATTTQPARVTETETHTVNAVRWPVFDGVDAEGLHLRPRTRPIARVIALPDADQTPEEIAGVRTGPRSGSRSRPPDRQEIDTRLAQAFARRLAENGCEVLVPTLIDRADTWSGNPRVRMTNQPHREYIYRMAFEVGRHIIGYEVQKVLAAVDWFAGKEAGDKLPIGVIGYGEGGLIAFYAAAVDTRIDAVCVSGYFGPREGLWGEPIYRNVWGLLAEFGDAEIAGLICPRTLIIEAGAAPQVDGPPPVREGRSGAAPGRIVMPPIEEVRAECERARPFYRALQAADRLAIVVPDPDEGARGKRPALEALLGAMGQRKPLREAARPKGAAKVAVSVRPPGSGSRPAPPEKPIPPDAGRRPDGPAEARLRRQFVQLVEHTQRVVRDSAEQRRTFWAKANTTSSEKWQESCKEYRDYLWDEVIGRCPPPGVPIRARTRCAYVRPLWTGYDVVLDVWPDVFAYGVLLVPNDIRPGERRPVVVCQHGLEGRPQQVVDANATNPFYHAYGASLAERGFVVYAPQNPYIGGDAFRVIQRKANPLKQSLFGVIVRQHERTLEWLTSLPFVDPKRIALYGLSYGGKTAMRVPALLPQYCLSVCSGDFNEWIVKVTSVDLAGTYMFTGEYEIGEFDMGSTFNYAELAGLIFPRPFMVERGHHDPVGIDEMVSWEYAKVRRLYSDMGLSDLTCIEFFPGRHEIHGVGTFEFLHKHLRWPVPKSHTRPAVSSE